MNKKNLMLLFILSFISVIFTLNNLCYRYVDNRIDTYFIRDKYQTNNTEIINQVLDNKPVRIISENKRLFITLTISFVFLIELRTKKVTVLNE